MIEFVNFPDDIKGLSLRDLEKLAQEIRDFLIKSIKVTGGHLASNLGIVELSLSIAKVFDIKKNPVIYDVSHQSYVHKIITGRKDFSKLRKINGLSGYTDPDESEYDYFKLGHAGTSISLGLGIKYSSDFYGNDVRPIVVIGDASISNGVAFEALNHLGYSKKDLIIVLNDNQMSISETVGALSKYLSDFMNSKVYLNIINISKNISSILGDCLKNKAEKMARRIDNLVRPNIFNVLGIKYIGPFDGHNIKSLVNVFEYVKTHKGPFIVHTITKKGKGLKEAEDNPSFFHGLPGIDYKKEETFTDVFSKTMVEIGKKYKNVYAITAAMSEGTGLNKFAKVFPERYIDVGIAEEHAVALSSGMSISGIKPVVAIYSTFLQRAFDQLFQEVSLQNKVSPVFVLDRAGIVGPDGPTHHGVFDIAYTKVLPRFVLMSPKDGKELEKMLYFAIESDYPVVLRFPKAGFFNFDICEDISLAKAEIIEFSETAVVNVFCYGSIIGNAFNALRDLNIHFNLVNLRFAKPIDEETIVKISSNKKPIITVEEHSLIGGVGESINSIIVKNKLSNNLLNIGLSDFFYPHGNREDVLSIAGLNDAGIKKIVKEFLGI